MSLAQVDNNSKKRLLHVAVATYEFTYSPFSGNGILARSLVKSLLQHHHGCCRVTVWCCQPHQHDHDEDDDDDDQKQNKSSSSNNNNNNNHLEPPEITAEEKSRLQVYSVLLASEKSWRRLDDESAWFDFVWNNLVNTDQQQELFAKVLQSIDVRCAIDWTGAHAWRSVPESVWKREDSTTSRTLPPLIYLNFRVYSSGVPDKSKHAWYDNMERMALKEANSIVALSHKDVASLHEILSTRNNGTNDDTDAKREIRVLLPPLRGDMELLALSCSGSSNLDHHLPPAAADAIAGFHNKQDRPFVTCVVRLSPEKEAMRFVDFIRANQDLFEEENGGGYIALVAGTKADATYAARVETELQEITKANPSCQILLLLDSFLSPHNLGAIFARTALNFHPCSYDAYGMTIIEAAAFGVPSVIAKNGSSVGASAIVGNDASIAVDFSSNDFYSIVRQALANPQELQEIGAVARKRALSWDEAAYGAKLLEYMQSMI